MKKIFITILVLISIASLLSIALNYFNSLPEEKSGNASLEVGELLSASDTSGFKRAFKEIDFDYSRDIGNHPGWKTEWWYFTGNLKTKNGRLFGYQFTIFRHTLKDKRNSISNEIFMSHIAVSDISNKKFYSAERIERQIPGLSGADTFQLSVFIHNIKAIGKYENGVLNATISTIPLKADSLDKSILDKYLSDKRNGKNQKSIFRNQAEEFDFIFNLSSSKAPVKQGVNGLSQKSVSPGNASYYFSFSRLETSGIIRIGNEEFEVVGVSWFDREWSTSALSSDQAGWDWFSLQLNDNSELMFYRMRLKNGMPDATSRGIYILPDGNISPIQMNEIIYKETQYWKSPDNRNYPIAWNFEIDKLGLELLIIPYFENQLHQLSVQYWEGAVRVNGSKNGSQLNGSGYVELTGY